ncbi:peptidoglycan DD-metalloendopeptidase family protein [Bacillus tianshenii]|nr:peptidoglycan DD-metalloendopeptidase family protein [Bacillus tianshenii]
MFHLYKKLKGRFSTTEEKTPYIREHRELGKMFRRATLVACSTLLISISSVYADNQKSNLETVYHVYLEGERIGTVDDKGIVQQVIEEKVSDAEKNYDKYNLSAGEELQYIPEKVFRPQYNNNEVEKNLTEKLAVQAEATALKIDDEVVAYVKDKEEAEKLIESLKLQYVSQEILSKVEKNKETKDEPIADGDSKIIDVRLSKKVSIEEGKTVPEDILSVKKAIKLFNKGTLEPKKHEIQEGEVLGNIASQYDLSVKKLLELNPGVKENSLIQIGDQLNVQEYMPFVDVIIEKKGRSKQELPFEIEVVETDEMYRGDTKVKQAGQKGAKSTAYMLVKKNGKVVSKQILEEKTLKEPVKKIVYKGTKVVPSRGTGELEWPTHGGTITSVMGYRWGRQHKGIDIAGVSNRSIKAADNGVVEFAGRDGGYGNKVVVNHNNGTKTLYAHLSEINVQVGQTVPRGTKIGVMGTTGDSTGVHLHFEVLKNGSNVDPQNYF